MSSCHCGSSEKFKHCCALIHNGTHIAQNAEQLMRARFSAYVTGDMDFLLETYHSSCNAHLERRQIQEATKTAWVKLDIIDAPATAADAKYAFVEFKAWYMDENKLSCLHERSRFTKEQSGGQLQWRYLDGNYPEASSSTAKVGRNDLCPCNSGKKFKKCCALI